MKKKRRFASKTIRRVVPTRPTVAEIDLRAIAFNLKGVRERVGRNVKIMAVVKANAYGHGLESVTKFVERLADCFGVAYPEEGMALRTSGVEKPIHVFALAAPRQAPLYADYDLEPTVSSIRDIELMDSAGRKQRNTLPVHLKVETGMNRIGVQRADLGDVLAALGRARRLELKGVFTHFATADERDKSFLTRQIEEFRRILDDLRIQKVEAELTHCANSACILDAPETFFSMVRPGIMMYGYYPSKTTTGSIPLKPAMTLKTTVSLIKQIDAGESVSYGRRFVAERKTKIATLPVGYADGIMRILTGRMEALICGNRFPVVGSICMDQIMVNVGEAGVSVGDEAVLLGRQGGESVSAWDLAEKVGTIPYEICCAVSSRVPRIHIS
ncbi:MAG: alanine racemase [Ignavibacteriales bacterium]|nr:alanine racemase [Ignavibacteriales bacterium]